MGFVLNYFLYFAVQILSKTKYQTAFANGSTIASVRATIKDTSAINIKTVIAIAKWPIVYIIVLNIEPLLFWYIAFDAEKIPCVNSVI